MTPSQEYAEKASQEYAEKLAEDPSQFYDDEAEEKTGPNVTPKATKATAKAIAKSAEKAAAQAAHDKKVADIKALMTPEQLAMLLAAARTERMPHGEQAKIHKDNLTKAMANIEETMNDIKTKHDGKFFELHMLMLFCDEWKQSLLDVDEVDKFTKWLGTGDTKTNLGLSKKGGKAILSIAPSPNVSRGVTPGFDFSINEDAGAGAD